MAAHRKPHAELLRNRNANNRRWRAKNPVRNAEHMRKQHLRRLFNISVEDYDRMLVAQKGVCAICLKPETAVLNGVVKRLAVDHDHETNIVRGLLCTHCNTGLGHFKDSPVLLDRAKGYLCRAA